MKLSYVLDALDKSIKNLGTINLHAQVKATKLDQQKLIETYNMLFSLRKEIRKEAKNKKRLSKGNKTNDRDK